MDDLKTQSKYSVPSIDDNKLELMSEYIQAGFVSGTVGVSGEKGQMCMESLASYLFDQESQFSDHPYCVNTLAADIGINLNDTLYCNVDRKERAKYLKDYFISHLGSYVSLIFIRPKLCRMLFACSVIKAIVKYFLEGEGASCYRYPFDIKIALDDLLASCDCFIGEVIDQKKKIGNDNDLISKDKEEDLLNLFEDVKVKIFFMQNCKCCSLKKASDQQLLDEGRYIEWILFSKTLCCGKNIGKGQLRPGKAYLKSTRRIELADFINMVYPFEIHNSNHYHKMSKEIVNGYVEIFKGIGTEGSKYLGRI